MKAVDVINKYIEFFEEKGHKKIVNSPLIPQNDPTTLFTSSGMQPLIQYFLGEPHPLGKRLVNVQNCFRALDIDEVGDNRHTTFFRMLGNWSLGDYFKREQLVWYFEFLTKEIGLPKEKLYISTFDGDEKFKVITSKDKYETLKPDVESKSIWTEIFHKAGIESEGKIFFYGTGKNWWSRSGTPEQMPIGEIGGPDSEVFYDLGTSHDENFGEKCHPNCQCGRFIEIGNSVFMQYRKIEDKTFEELPQKNVDFGGGLERLLAAIENKKDNFETSLFSPIVKTVEEVTKSDYKSNSRAIRIIADHLIAAVFIAAAGTIPSNKEQGYVLRRLLRRALDNYYLLGGKGIEDIIYKIVEQYKDTDPYLVNQFETIKNSIIEEMQVYEPARTRAQREYLSKKYPLPGQFVRRGDEIIGEYVEITPREAFNSLASYGTAPIQLESLGYKFDRQGLAEEIKQHQQISKAGATKKFTGGLADHSNKTIMGHTATHLLHQALRDVLGNKVFQIGSNIASERIRFDFSYDKKLMGEEILEVEKIVNEKIEKNLSVHFEVMPLKKAKEIGAIGLFDEKYENNVKIYFIGDYSIEFCGGPHVEFTGKLKRFKIIKQENIGHGQRRIYAKVGTFL